MKKLYEKPEAELLSFELADVISNDGTDVDGDVSGGGDSEIW